MEKRNRAKEEIKESVMKKTVWCTFTFEHWHRWKTAPISAAYLKSLHRHLFHVRCVAPVTHEDRDIEFISMKSDIAAAVHRKKSGSSTQEWSCEHWCSYLLNAFPFLSEVTVSEDGENGATITRE